MLATASAPASVGAASLPDGLLILRAATTARAPSFDVFMGGSGGASTFSPQLERTWIDLEAANSRRLELGRRVVERLAGQVSWLQAQEVAAGVPEAELQPLIDQVARELKLSGAMYSLTGVGEIQSELVGVARASAHQRAADLRTLVDDTRRIGVDDPALIAAIAAADLADGTIGSAPDTGALWEAIDRLSGSFGEVLALKSAREAVLAAEAEAAQRARDWYNSLAGLRQRGYDALASGRNYLAWAAFIGKGGFGPAIGQLEAGAVALETNDRPALEVAVANEQRLAAAVQQEFVGKLPPKVILVSIAGEELWAYDNGSLVVHTLITTGRPELPTDVGLMRVYRKNSPWLMRSPWGPGSPYWYPDLTVRYAMWFHPSGEAIHDSWWRGWYGPGSNLGGYGSHGCIGLPYGPIEALFAWTPIDTPVVVIPGDGSPAAVQLSQRTYNDPAMAARFGV